VADKAVDGIMVSVSQEDLAVAEGTAMLTVREVQLILGSVYRVKDILVDLVVDLINKVKIAIGVVPAVVPAG
jgi:hypothetical protein